MSRLNSCTAISSLLLIFVTAGNAAADNIVVDSCPYYMPYPIVFVHGLASDSTAWNGPIGDYARYVIKTRAAASAGASPVYGLDDYDPLLPPNAKQPLETAAFFSRANYGNKDPKYAYLDHGNFEHLDANNDPSRAIQMVVGSLLPDTATYNTPDTDCFFGFVSLRTAIDAALNLQAQIVEDVNGVRMPRIPRDHRKVILVGHSTGGLIIREFIRRLGDKRPEVDTLIAPNQTYRDVIDRVVFVTVPHQGSPLANLLYHAGVMTESRAYDSYIAAANQEVINGGGWLIPPTNVPGIGMVSGTTYPFGQTETTIAWAHLTNRLEHAREDAREAPVWLARVMYGYGLVGQWIPYSPLMNALRVPIPSTITETYAETYAPWIGSAVTVPPTPYTLTQTYPAGSFFLEQFGGIEAPEAVTVPPRGGDLCAAGHTARVLGGLLRAFLQDQTLWQDINGLGLPAALNALGIFANGSTAGAYSLATSAIADWDRHPIIERMNGAENFDDGYRMLDITDGDGVVSPKSQTGLAMHLATPMRLIEANHVSVTDASGEILSLMDFDPPRLSRPRASMAVDENGNLRSGWVIDIDELHLVHARIDELDVVRDDGSSYAAFTIDQVLPGMRGPYSIYGDDSAAHHIDWWPDDDNIRGDWVTTQNIPEDDDIRLPGGLPLAGYRPFMLHREDFNRYRLNRLIRYQVDSLALLAPNGDTYPIGAGQFWLPAGPDLTDNPPSFDHSLFDFSGRTGDLLVSHSSMESAAFYFTGVGTPPYVQSIVINADDVIQHGGVELRKIDNAFSPDTWDRRLIDDTRLQGLGGLISVLMTFNQKVVDSTDTLEIWNGTDTPKINLRTVGSVPASRYHFGAFSPDSLAHTGVGVFRLAVSGQGRDTFIGPLDGDPRTIAWYDPIADTYRAYEQGPDTLHRIFVGPTVVKSINLHETSYPDSIYFAGHWKNKDDTTAEFVTESSTLGPGETQVLHIRWSNRLDTPEVEHVRLRYKPNQSTYSTTYIADTVAFDTALCVETAIVYLPPPYAKSGTYVVTLKGWRAGDTIDGEPGTRAYAQLGDTTQQTWVGDTEQIFNWEQDEDTYEIRLDLVKPVLFPDTTSYKWAEHRIDNNHNYESESGYRVLDARLESDPNHKTYDTWHVRGDRPVIIHTCPGETDAYEDSFVSGLYRILIVNEVLVETRYAIWQGGEYLETDITDFVSEGRTVISLIGEDRAGNRGKPVRYAIVREPAPIASHVAIADADSLEELAGLPKEDFSYLSRLVPTTADRRVRRRLIDGNAGNRKNKGLVFFSAPMDTAYITGIDNIGISSMTLERLTGTALSSLAMPLLRRLFTLDSWPTNTESRVWLLTVEPKPGCVGPVTLPIRGMSQDQVTLDGEPRTVFNQVLNVGLDDVPDSLHRLFLEPPWVGQVKAWRLPDLSFIYHDSYTGPGGEVFDYGDGEFGWRSDPNRRPDNLKCQLSGDSVRFSLTVSGDFDTQNHTFILKPLPHFGDGLPLGIQEQLPGGVYWTPKKQEIEEGHITLEFSITPDDAQNQPAWWSRFVPSCTYVLLCWVRSPIDTYGPDGTCDGDPRTFPELPVDESNDGVDPVRWDKVWNVNHRVPFDLQAPVCDLEEVWKTHDTSGPRFGWYNTNELSVRLLIHEGRKDGDSFRSGLAKIEFINIPDPPGSATNMYARSYSDGDIPHEVPFVDTFDLSSILCEGNNQVTIRATDRVGNVSEQQFTLLVDSVKPTLSYYSLHYSGPPLGMYFPYTLGPFEGDRDLNEGNYPYQDHSGIVLSINIFPDDAVAEGISYSGFAYPPWLDLQGPDVIESWLPCPNSDYQMRHIQVVSFSITDIAGNRSDTVTLTWGIRYPCPGQTRMMGMDPVLMVWSNTGSTVEDQMLLEKGGAADDFTTDIATYPLHIPANEIIRMIMGTGTPNRSILCCVETGDSISRTINASTSSSGRFL